VTGAEVFIFIITEKRASQAGRENTIYTAVFKELQKRNCEGFMSLIEGRGRGNTSTMFPRAPAGGSRL
jgi:hypothetical protein